jgi:hypothetical protein
MMTLEFTSCLDQDQSEVGQTNVIVELCRFIPFFFMPCAGD